MFSPWNTEQSQLLAIPSAILISSFGFFGFEKQTVAEFWLIAEGSPRKKYKWSYWIVSFLTHQGRARESDKANKVQFDEEIKLGEIDGCIIHQKTGTLD